MQLFRISDTRFKDEALSGQGAAIYGGRWNTPGRRASYFSVNTELAVLESTIRRPRPLKVNWHLITIEIDDKYLQALEKSVLPPTWRDRIYMGRPVQFVLDHWFNNQESVGILVPSALIISSHNVIVNPEHPEFTESVSVVSNEPFVLY